MNAADDIRIPPKPLRITLAAPPRLAPWQSLPLAAVMGLTLGMLCAGLLA